MIVQLFGLAIAGGIVFWVVNGSVQRTAFKSNATVAVAQERINDALGTLRMVEASRDELMLAVGLTPGVAYQIADDGTVTAEISGQGSEGLDGNGTV